MSFTCTDRNQDCFYTAHFVDAQLFEAPPPEGAGVFDRKRHMKAREF